MSRTSLTLYIIAVIVLVGGAGLVFELTHKGTLAEAQSNKSVTVTASTTQMASAAVSVSTTTSTQATSTTLSVGVDVAAVAQPAMKFEVVSTPTAQQQGLGGRAIIPDNYAMLFVFPTANTYGFWMKDMLVPIDMIWLTNDGTIIKIDGSVPADSYPDVYYPPSPVKYVLETKAGFAVEHGWTVGTKVTLPAPY